MTEPTKNRVLLSLDAETRAAVLDACERTERSAGTILERAGDATSAGYFPETAVISTLASYSDGATVDMANVGREGCAAINLTLGHSTHLSTDEIQIAGTVLMLPAERFRRLQAEHRAFERALFSSVQALIYQVMVSGACNASHDARQRLARWLLTLRDRSDGREMRLTHEFLAHMLGVRRATVTEAASGFRKAGLIDYAHGRVTIEDRAGLRSASCECYDLVRRTTDALLPDRSAASS
ncbi:Crp/Fnr family transcriptional regulator [Roseibacterium sp. SDUM158017]|uniref:Crp/Fnr family transcriptional regulator n=1 Tax=Roseicyclus salinarum TaxID=3036773 RepID=UPI0024157335|nr:Crp/Fnr family transcriptional regulator [Roseibacterium sp. SDUM158017]MDG4647689.1 Crp/Fnr family transcriptional regulator [Roseibacterium sp. SDUM158017]